MELAASPKDHHTITFPPEPHHRTPTPYTPSKQPTSPPWTSQSVSSHLISPTHPNIQTSKHPNETQHSPATKPPPIPHLLRLQPFRQLLCLALPTHLLPCQRPLPHTLSLKRPHLLSFKHLMRKHRRTNPLSIPTRITHAFHSRNALNGIFPAASARRTAACAMCLYFFAPPMLAAVEGFGEPAHVLR